MWKTRSWRMEYKARVKFKLILYDVFLLECLSHKMLAIWVDKIND